MSEKFKNVRYALVSMLLFYCAALQAQSVTGNVKDSMGEPVIGATVMEKGTKNGTVTDFDGNFTIKMSSTSHDLQISYVGMKTANVKVGNKTQLDVTLEDDATTLNEV
ncbi:MAG: carboxypeptidase-like regulatory domain-containing protein, partial [Prevotella sp.]|nr:carboxypeptidase-like regulatory domain-containing protein [Prevotella sp.]